MNVYYNGTCFFNVKIEEVACFYFCDHFYKAFREKKLSKMLLFFDHTQLKSWLLTFVSAKKKIMIFVQYSIIYLKGFLSKQKTV